MHKRSRHVPDDDVNNKRSCVLHRRLYEFLSTGSLMFTTADFLQGTDILNLVVTCKSANSTLGLHARRSLPFRTSDPRFGMICHPCDDDEHCCETIQQMQKLFPKGDGLCISADLGDHYHGTEGTYTIFSRRVQEAIEMLMGLKSRKTLNICLVNAWITECVGTKEGCGNLHPDVIYNDVNDVIMFVGHMSAICRQTTRPELARWEYVSANSMENPESRVVKMFVCNHHLNANVSNCKNLMTLGCLDRNKCVV